MLNGPLDNANPYLELYRAFWRFARKLGLAGGTYGSGNINLAETHFLVVVDASLSMTPSEISNRLNLDKQTVSRLTLGLAERGFISQTAGAQDRRKRHIKLTSKGQKELRRLDIAGNAIFERWAARISSDEEDRLNRLFERLADGLGAAEGELRASDHKLRCHMRRVARQFGVLAVRNKDTEVSSTERHVLLFIAAAKKSDSITQKLLSAELQLDTSTLSRVVARLERAAFVKRLRTATDLRSSQLSLTAKGEQFVKKIDHQVAQRIKDALNGLSQREVQDFLELFERFFEGGEEESVQMLQNMLVTREIQSNEQRRTARTFLIENLQRIGRHTALSARIFDRSGVGYQVLSNDRLVGVCEIYQENEESASYWVLGNAYFDRNKLAEKFIDATVNSCILEFKRRYGGVDFKILRQI